MANYLILAVREKGDDVNRLQMALYTPLEQKGKARLFAKTAHRKVGQLWEDVEFFPLLTPQSIGTQPFDLDAAFAEAWNAVSPDPAMRYCIHQTILKYLMDNRYNKPTTEKVLIRDLSYIHQKDILTTLEMLKELDFIECQRKFIFLSELGLEYLSKGESLFVFLGANLETKVLEKAESIRELSMTSAFNHP